MFQVQSSQLHDKCEKAQYNFHKRFCTGHSQISPQMLTLQPQTRYSVTYWDIHKIGKSTKSKWVCKIVLVFCHINTLFVKIYIWWIPARRTRPQWWNLSCCARTRTLSLHVPIILRYLGCGWGINRREHTRHRSTRRPRDSSLQSGGLHPLPFAERVWECRTSWNIDQYRSHVSQPARQHLLS